MQRERTKSDSTTWGSKLDCVNFCSCIIAIISWSLNFGSFDNYRLYFNSWIFCRRKGYSHFKLKQ